MSKFQIGDRVRLAYNPEMYSPLNLGGTGTVHKIDDKSDRNLCFLLVKWDENCGLSEIEQKLYWIEARFDFAEDHELAEVGSDVGSLLFG